MIRLLIRPVEHLGLDMFQVILIDQSGMTLALISRWSDRMARRDAIQWAQKNGYKIKGFL